jgi:hypothetical protein
LTTDAPRPSVARWPFALLIALGLALRLVRYGWRDSLWGDEAMLALSIAGRSYTGLLHPLDYGQVAPVPFLWMERAAVQLFGANEYALRALPLLAASVLLLLLLPFGRRFLTPLESLIAVGLAGASPWLIRYSVELKPYGLDALVTLLMLWAAVEVRQDQSRLRPWVRLGVVAAAGGMLSPTSLFVCAGIVAGLGLDLVFRPSFARAAGVAAVGVACAGAVATGYHLWYRSAAEGSYMRDYWKEAFLMPGTPGLTLRVWSGVRESLLPVVDWMALLPWGGLLLLLLILVLGAVRIGARQGVALPVMLAAPMLAAFLASALGRYPIGARLMLFASPLLICLAAAGVVGGAEWIGRGSAAARRVAAVGFLIPSIAIAIGVTLSHPRSEEMRPIVAALGSPDRATEPAYVFYRGIPAWAFYTTDWDAPDTLRVDRIAREAGPGGRSHENGASRGARPPHEAAGLIEVVGRRTELLGLSSGVRGRHGLGYEPASPDPNWAANEATRIRAWAGTGAAIWVVLVNDRNAGEGDSLVAAVRRAGGTGSDSVVVPGGRALRVAFAAR